jgi:hypothetical protein
MTQHEFKIEKNIPLPNVRDKSIASLLRQMEIGDSFFYPNGKHSFSGRFSSLRPKKFVVRTVLENGIKGIRVWRVA